MTDSSTNAPAILSLEEAGYSSREIAELKRAIRSFEEVVLPFKKKREAQAEAVLRQFKGQYTVEILDKVFDLVDKGRIGPITGAWFGKMLISNKKRLYRCPMLELNMVIDKLRETGDLGCLGEWRRASKVNRGMRTGAATLFMYLHSPERYNVWLTRTHSGLSRLCRLDGKSPEKIDSPDKYRKFYKEFNDNAIAVRKEKGLAPQTMDWFLFAVEEIKTNPDNRGLRALIEGRTE